MSNVIDLQDHLPVWRNAPCECSECHTEFVSVFHKDTDPTKLECPNCGLMTGSAYIEIEEAMHLLQKQIDELKALEAEKPEAQK